MPATPKHTTPTNTGPWDAAVQVKRLKTPLSIPVGDRTFAWRDPGHDPTTKAAWKLPHHLVDIVGVPGSASTVACQAAIAALNGAQGGVDIPAGDRRPVWEHLAGHLHDAGLTVPELKSHAPGGERHRAREDMRGVRETRAVPMAGFTLREAPNGTGGANLTFEGYASVTCSSIDDDSHSYEMQDLIGPYRESIIRGAFGKTLAEGADVAFLVNHEGVSMARTKPGTLQLSEDSTGLHVAASLNPSRPDVQILRAAIEDGALDEMSFAFRVVRQDWSYAEDNGVEDRRYIREVNLDKGDVSAVNYGASPHTGGLVDMRGRRTASSGRPARTAPVIVPDYGPAARLALARARMQPSYTPRGVPNHVAEARRRLARLR
jgi:HK97 family phage prohead protease